MPDALDVRGLTVAYGPTTVLDSVNLSVGEGEVLALLGPSGSGKSTLLNAIAGFISIRSGEITLGTRLVATPNRADPPERREVAFVFQDYGLWPHLTALDTVAYPLRRRGVRREAARAQAQQILDRLGIGALADRKPAQLSGGEQQRVGLGRALARQAVLYLFDEPTAHLDAHLRDVFLGEIAARRRETGAAAIYATHDAAEALGSGGSGRTLGRGSGDPGGYAAAALYRTGERSGREADRSGVDLVRCGGAGTGPA